jgi:hypothetical protein
MTARAVPGPQGSEGRGIGPLLQRKLPASRARLPSLRQFDVLDTRPIGKAAT